ncbi:MAG: hypothetical protein ACMUEM_02335 [Flavobacteriales bacterium AspAUS03]
MNSHPVEIFLDIVIRRILFNILEVILVVPVYTALRVILRECFIEHE